MDAANRAKRTIIYLGNIPLEIFQLPNGEYRLSQTQVTKVIGKPNRSIIQFLDGKNLEAIPHQGFELSNSLAVEDSNKPISPVTIPVATAYWRYWDKRDNEQASSLVSACVAESLERRADAAFGVQRTEAERNEQFTLSRQNLSLLVPSSQSLFQSPQDSVLYTLDEYLKIAPLIKKEYRQAIPNFPESKIVEAAVLLAARTDEWQLKLEAELRFFILNRKKFSYPDLASNVLTINIDSEPKRVVFAFECKDPIVDIDDIKECIYDRRYLSATKQKYSVDYVFLTLVAPFGATPYVQAYIEQSLAPEDKDCVQVLTVKQFFTFLNAQVARGTENPEKKKEISRNIRPLLNYQIPRLSSKGSES